MEGIEFTRQDTIGSGFRIEVTRGGISIGHIRKQPDTGVYRYFRGVRNELGAVYSHRNLEALMRWILQNP